MRNRTRLAIRAAVMNGMASCADSDIPLTCLSEFLEKLAEIGWQPEEIATVRNLVLKLLLASQAPPKNDANDATVAVG